jgi:HSP20 family protein
VIIMSTITLQNGAKQHEAMPAVQKPFAFDPFADLLNDRRSLLDWTFRPYRPIAETATFDVDLYEKDGKIVVECELPGFQKNEFNIAVTDNRLTISAKKEEKHDEHDGRYAYRERRLGRFERIFAFADPIDPSTVDATYREGLLRVEFPIAKTPESKKIAIKA